MTGVEAAASRWVVWTTRTAYMTLIFMAVTFQGQLQVMVNRLWSYLMSTWLFNCVYFETWWATVVYAIILAVPYLMDKCYLFDRYKLNKDMKWKDAGLWTILLEGVEYCAPLMLLDTFMVKHYCGVDPAEWVTRRKSLVQYTRALPVEPPTVFQVAYELLGAFILYDILFYLVHVTLHKNMWLYKYVHAVHHDHDTVQSRVTNKLTVPERIALVLSANEALRILNAHPLTRTIFVPLFMGWLVENHCGYDLPWTLDKVVPFKLVGGSAYHYSHHVHGDSSYQPFFTYIDKYVNRKSKNNKQM